MKKGKKLGNLLNILPKKTIKHKSSLNTTGKSPLSAMSVGRKVDGLETQSSTSYHSSCYSCPLSVYIDIVCDDKLESLIISGTPSREVLEEAKFNLVTEFSEISNNGESKAFSEIIKSYYLQRNILLGFELSLKLIVAGKFQKGIEYLNENGVKCSIPETEEQLKKLVNLVQMKMKNRIVKLKEARSRYNALSSGKGEKPTRRYFNKLLIILSTCEVIKMQLNPKKMTVAEFAEYLNIYNEYQNHLKIQKHAKR